MLAAAGVNGILIQAAGFVTAITIIVGGAVAGARCRPIRWVFRQLVGAPSMAWFDKHVDERVEKHTAPILTRVAELVPNGGGSWRDLWEKDRKANEAAMRRLDKRTSDTQKLVTEAAQLYVAVNNGGKR